MDVRLSDTRDLAAAEAFFRAAWMTTGVIPEHITTDGHDAYPRAVRSVFGEQVAHRTDRYLNNHLEQDHRGIKQRYRSMCGFKTFGTAAGFCRLFDEIRAFSRSQSQRNQSLTLVQRRDIYQERFRTCWESWLRRNPRPTSSPTSPDLGGVRVDTTPYRVYKG